MVLAGYVAYVTGGWFLSGLGSVLPELEAQLGTRSALFQLFPGAVLLVGGIAVARRQSRSGSTYRQRDLGVATVGLALGVMVMGATSSFGISTVGALLASVAVGAMIRILPGLFAIESPDNAEQVLVRANAWSSLSAIASPIAISVSIGLGLGWLPGMEVLLIVGAIIVPLCIRASSRRSLPPSDRTGNGPPPPLATWWAAWMVLWLSIVLEFSFAYYASTYLHDEVGLSIAAATSGAAAWAIGMTVGRFVIGAWRAPRSILPSALVVMLGFVLLWLIATPVAAIAGLAIAGLGTSPLFPTRASALLERFDQTPNQGSTYAAIASGAALLAAPALMAFVRSVTDVRVAYLLVPVIVGLLVVLDRTARSERQNALPEPATTG